MLQDDDRQALCERYERALQTVVASLQSDPQVLAVQVYGSMARGDMWRKSDIDLCVIVKDQKLTEQGIMLCEEDILISIEFTQRSEFIRFTESAMTGSVHHGFQIGAKLLYLRDENLRQYFDRFSSMGDRDRDLQYLESAAGVIWLLDKAEKWVEVFDDPLYAFWWVQGALENLGALEALRNGEAPLREAYIQGERLRPDFFTPLFRGIQEKTPEAVSAAIETCREELRANTRTYFRAVLQYLQEEAGARSITQLSQHFRKRGVTSRYTYENIMPWLCELGYAAAVTLSARATPKSRAELNEAAYIYVQDAREVT